MLVLITRIHCARAGELGPLAIHMTLVAAFSVNGVPALVGDFLITDNYPHANHIFLPTKPDLRNKKPESGKRRICGVRKKIHKIGERLVVGFTGDLRAPDYP